jgi:signal transduction histidine kinase
LLGIVLLGAVLPLALIGLWLTWSAVGTGKRLLDDQLGASLQGVERSIAARWEARRGDLLLLAGNENARDALASGVVSGSDSAYFMQLQAALKPGIPLFGYRDLAGRDVYSSARRQGTRGGGSTPVPRVMHVRYPVRVADTVAGSVEADVSLDAIIPPDSARLLLPGSVLALRDRAHHVALLRLSANQDFPAGRDVPIKGAPWRALIDSLPDPPFDLAVAAPLGPYVAPFEHAGHIGLAALLAVILIAVLLTNFLTARLARSVGALVNAVETVAGGDLTGEAAPSGPKELRQLASSFNTMTASLRRLIAELSQRRALAAVGEFAASLSHEVRNALTSVQIDLERVDERSEDARNRVLIGRTLAHVRRLDAAVTGSLRIARSGSMVAQAVNLHEMLDDAMRSAEPSFASTGGHLLVRPFDHQIVVTGDREALHQLILNLLLNAQQSLSPGGETSVSVGLSEDCAVVSIADTGCGMTDEQLLRAFEPHYTTRPKGTGLGLPIARQIAIAHGGELAIRSTAGVGTTVEVRLPLLG